MNCDQLAFPCILGQGEIFKLYKKVGDRDHIKKQSFHFLQIQIKRNEKMLASWKKIHDKPRQHIKKQRHYFADKDPYSQSYGFSSSHVWR